MPLHATACPFDAWVAQNAKKQYPSYIVAKQQYQGSRAAYEMALQHGDQEGYEAWNEKVKKEALDNMGPNGPNFNVLVGPN
ncbi:hypothetical protein LB507_010367 [Fusarium sp. FIESC RH6]|nr:hypothetical protein LB507_010367 [Fusarium sp. FIESC RH6]